MQKHLANVAEVRQRADSISKKAAVKMVEESSSPAEYAIGSKVLVRRFSSMSRKKAGKESASKNSRVVQGTITKRSQKAGTYRILYNLKGDQAEQWFKVSDITSLSLEEENTKQIPSKNELAVTQNKSEYSSLSTTSPPNHGNFVISDEVISFNGYLLTTHGCHRIINSKWLNAEVQYCGPLHFKTLKCITCCIIPYLLQVIDFYLQCLQVTTNKVQYLIA